MSVDSSSVISPATSSACRLSSSRNAKRILVRLLSEVCDQAGKASFAVAMAASTSSLSARRTSACWRPVAGLNTLDVRSERPPVALPPTQCWIVVVTQPPLFVFTFALYTVPQRYPSVGLDDEHRDGGLEYQVLGDTAEQRLPDWRPLPCTDHEHLRRERPNQLQNRGSGIRHRGPE